jgi:O-antigen/teichoic acid export membrane protein
MSINDERSRQLKNVIFASLASYGEYAIYLLCNILVARRLGPADYGAYSFCVLVCGWAIIASHNGMPISIVRFVADLRGRQDLEKSSSVSRMFWLWFHVAFLATALVLIAFGLFAPPSEWRTHLWLFLGLTLLTTWARSFCILIAANGKAFEDYSVGNRSGILGGVISLVLVLGATFVKPSVEVYFSIYAVSGMFACSYAFYKLRHHLVPTGRYVSESADGVASPNKKQIRTHIILTGITIGLWMLGNRTIETLLLKQHSTPEILGFFVLAGTLSKGILDIMIGGFEKVLLPIMSKKVGDGGGQSLSRMVSESVRLYVAIGMFSAGIALLGSEGLVTMLYGRGFEGAAVPLLIGLVSGSMFVFVGALNAFQISTDNQADRIKSMLLTLIPTCVIAFLLVPRFGLVGAAASVAISQLFNCIASVVQVRRKLAFVFPLEAMARLFLAALVASTICWMVKAELPLQWGFIVACLLYTLLFLGVSVLLKSWNVQDFDAICALLDRSPTANRALGNIVRLLRNKFAMR